MHEEQNYKRRFRGRNGKRNHRAEDTNGKSEKAEHAAFPISCQSGKESAQQQGAEHAEINWEADNMLLVLGGMLQL